jgi:hypothetical protein
MKYSKKSSSHILKVIFGIFTIIMLAGCAGLTPASPTGTPTPDGGTEPPATEVPLECQPMRIANSAGLALLTLADGSQVFLGPDTEFEFIPMGSCTGADTHRVTLMKGEIAISSLLSPDNPFTVFSPEGAKATLDKNGLVRIDSETGDFQVNCSNGNCTLGSEPQPQLLVCGQAGMLDLEGQYTGPDDIDLDLLTPYGDWLLPKCDLVPTETPATETPGPDVGATATAACSDWLNQFPLTPCPTTSNP